jgi:hypothetical protein
MKVKKRRLLSVHGPPFVAYYKSQKVTLTMIKFFLCVFFMCCLLISNGQITKTNWLVGGSATIDKQFEKLAGADIRGTTVQIDPNLGYFPIDKFCFGLRPSFGYSSFKKDSYHTQITTWAVGPFVRYYFLPSENRTNLFAESAYEYFWASNGGSHNQLVFSAGPVIYFNTSVGIEFTANYKIFHINNTETSAKDFFIGIGLQIHLETEKE